MRHVAGVLSEAVGDLVACYRLGGGEFTVLLPAIDRSDAASLAETIRSRVATAQLAHHGKILDPVTLSIGLAPSASGQPTAGVLRRADAALLAAKSAGWNQTTAA